MATRKQLDGFVRLKDLLAPSGPIPIGRSTLWMYVRDGRFPKPVKIGSRISAWRVEDVRSWIDRQR